MDPVERYFRLLTMMERIQQLAGEVLAIDDTTSDPEVCATLRATFACLDHGSQILEDHLDRTNPVAQLHLFTPSKT